MKNSIPIKEFISHFFYKKYLQYIFTLFQPLTPSPLYSKYLKAPIPEHSLPFQISVADAPMTKKKKKKISFPPPPQRTLKYRSKNRP